MSLVDLLKILLPLLLGGGFLWLYQVLRGGFFSTLSIRLTTERTHFDEKHDWLRVSVILKKGSVGSIDLAAIHLRLEAWPIGQGSMQPDHASIPIARLAPKNGNRHGVDWTQTDQERPYLNLNNGDECEFAHLFKIERRREAMVNAVVLAHDTNLGDRARSTDWASEHQAQWRASTASLPLPEASQ